MNEQTDSQLLRAYAEHRAESAFGELVRRHVDFVYSAALRMVCDSHLAEDVTQAVFVALAKDAPQLANRAVLSGWLHRTAQNIAAQTVRTDVRRRTREQEAAAMNQLLSDSGTGVPPVWSDIAPHLDAALGELSEPDRDALLLRYFERKSAREMAQVLGVSDEAAQKRVSRAVERLREFFTKRGISVGAGGLAVVISANAVHAAPVGLAVTISTAAAFAGTTTATIATSATMNWINVKSIGAIVAAAVAAGTGTHVMHQRETTRLRSDNQSLVAERDKSASERDAALSVAQANNDELERLRKNQNELLRLRGETGILRGQLSELEKLRAENRQLRELQRTTAKNVAEPETDPEFAYRRQRGRDAKILAGALIGYAMKHQQQYPVDFGQVAPHLSHWLRADLNPGDVLRDVADFAQVTNQFDIVYHGKWDALTNRGGTLVLREKQPWQNGGKWMKAYAFADGHSETIAEPPEGFDAWERQRIVPPQSADQ